MSNRLRQLARGQACRIRIAGVCNGNAETTIHAHYRLAGMNGIGMKPPDIIGAHACSSCHDLIDGRTKAPAGMTRAEVRLAHAEGVFRTQIELLKLGEIMLRGTRHAASEHSLTDSIDVDPLS